MKIFPFVVCIFSFASHNFAQTYRQAYDIFSNSPPSNYGQGASFQSNVIGILHNNEGIELQSYLNMYRATKDKRYLNRFIIQAHRVQMRRNDNIKNLPLNQIAGFGPSGNTGPSPFEGCIITNTQLHSLELDASRKSWAFSDGKDQDNICRVNDIALVHSGTITYPMAEFAYLILVEYANDMNLLNTPVPFEVSYVPPTTECNINHISTYYDFAYWLGCRVQETIDDHEDQWQYSSQQGQYTYSGGEFINGLCAMGRTLAMMYLATGNSVNHSHITDIANLLRKHLEEYSTAESENMPYYTWCYDWDCYYCGACWDGSGGCDHREDAGHAFLSMEFADICSKYNILSHHSTSEYNSGDALFNNVDMQKFANTVAHVMYLAPLTFAATTSGSNADIYCEGPSPDHYYFLIPYNKYLYQIMLDRITEDALYKPSDARGLALSVLSMAQSTYLNWNTLEHSNYKFNPIALRRGHSPGSNVYYMAGGDFDNNGLSDFVTMDFSNGVFHTNTPDKCINPNVFPSNCWVVASSSPHSANDLWKGIAAGNLDVNRPGDEIMALNMTQNQIYLLKQIGTSFTEESISSPLSWAGLTVGEFDPANPGEEGIGLTTNGNVYIIKYSNGMIQPPVFVSNLGITDIVGVASGNFDGTNVPQIAVLDNAQGNITIFKYEGGVFVEAYRNSDAGCCNAWNGIAAGNFDGDGVDNIAVHRDADGIIRVLKVKGNMLLSVYNEHFPIDQSIRAMSLGKFKLSGEKEALIVFRNYDGQIIIFSLDGQCPNFSVSDITVDQCYNLDPACYAAISDPNVSLPSVNNTYKTDFHANNALYVNNFIADVGSDVDFIAGNKIIVSSGSSRSVAKTGSRFHAYIDLTISCQETFRVSQPLSPGQPAIESKSIVKISENASAFEVYPNPAQGSFMFSVNAEKLAGNAELKIFDAMGREVMSKELTGHKEWVGIQSLPPGLYLVKVSSSKGEYVSKLQVR